MNFNSTLVPAADSLSPLWSEHPAICPLTGRHTLSGTEWVRQLKQPCRRMVPPPQCWRSCLCDVWPRSAWPPEVSGASSVYYLQRGWGGGGGWGRGHFLLKWLQLVSGGVPQHLHTYSGNHRKPDMQANIPIGT